MDVKLLTLYFEIFKNTEVKLKKKENIIKNFINFIFDNDLNEDYTTFLFQNIVEKNLKDNFDPSEKCYHCDGEGLDPYRLEYELCSICNGQGTISNKNLKF